ncbi:siderophore ABC transporter substrate-binding protein [Ornithinicoccus halotolerans]|uniref:siderophore ABC transporter substrate-binding protein n=1 Tax=Ornithinicoccus halotolerans TaxID=1748220 RepID=UPI001296F598|nr:ABC transporter substrate-binding protein [Ornithinicoccus halotolerans]
MTIRHRTAAAAAALPVTAALLLAGCGGNGSPEPESQAQEPAAGAEADVDEGGEAGETVTIVDAQDREVEVPVEPEVIVAMDWGVIRTLSDLGVEVDGVPGMAGALPADLAGYAEGDVAQVGTVFEPDYEAIEAMNPDLVIVGSRSGTPEVVAEFENFAPAVVDLSVREESPDELFDLVEERVLQLGEIVDRTDEAQQLMGDLRVEVEAVRTEAEASGETAMVVQVSDGTVAAYGPNSRFGTVFKDFGYAATDAPVDGTGSHGEEVSQEFFVQYNPGVLFVLDRAKAIGEEQTPALDVLNNGLVGTTDAAANDTIVELDGFSWYLAPAAPSSWQQMVDDVRASL